MFISCWRALGYPSFITSSTILNGFDGNTFHPHGIISALPIELGGKTIFIEVEVVDAPIDYNLLLGCPWFYEMKSISSLLFHVFYFPHQGKVVTIDQFTYCTPNLRDNASANVPFVGNSPRWCSSIGAGLFKDSSLLGTFPLPPPNTT